MIDNRAAAAAPGARCIAVTLGAAGEGGGRDIECLAAGTQGDERVPPQLESLERVPAVDVDRSDPRLMSRVDHHEKADHTIFAVVEGAVEFNTKRNGRVYVSVRDGESQSGE